MQWLTETRWEDFLRVSKMTECRPPYNNVHLCIKRYTSFCIYIMGWWWHTIFGETYSQLYPFSVNVNRKLVSFYADQIKQKHYATEIQVATSLHMRELQRYWAAGLLNFSKPTGHVMHQQSSIQQLYVMPTLYLCVLYLSENKQRLVPLTA